MEIFKVQLGHKEFSVVGIANVIKKTVKFQAHINGIPFVQDESYEAIREVLMETIELNQPEKNKEAQ